MSNAYTKLEDDSKATREEVVRESYGVLAQFQLDFAFVGLDLGRALWQGTHRQRVGTRVETWNKLVRVMVSSIVPYDSAGANQRMMGK